MKALALSMLIAFAGFATAQTQAPTPTTQTQPPSQDPPPAPRKPLNLSLDPADQPRSRINFEPRQDKKAPVEQTLPGMGGQAARNWERPSEQVFPADTNPGR